MTPTVEFHPEQEVFVLYLQRVPPISPVIRLETNTDAWLGKLHHIPSGKVVAIQDMEELLPALTLLMQEKNPAPSVQVGLK